MTMKVTGTISALLQNKGSQVYTIAPDTAVFEAIRVMAEKNIGALAVLSGGKVVGVFSERDYTRKVALLGRSSKETRVSEIVSAPVISASPDSSVEECMRLMTNHRIRHLPVLDGDRLAGMVSIGDLVNWIISTQSQEIDQLKTYITGQYPG
jgi:CBS domain-containing protein